MLHNALKIGNFWAAIPNPQYATWALCHCQECDNVTETLEHILLECSSPECQTIWRLTKALWPTNAHPWPHITIGTILGCGSLTLSPPDPTNNHYNKLSGVSQLLWILISEAAHLIWVLRCEQVISGTRHSTNTIKSRWQHKIDHHLQLDRLIAKKIQQSKLSNGRSNAVHGNSTLSSRGVVPVVTTSSTTEEECPVRETYWTGGLSEL